MRFNSAAMAPKLSRLLHSDAMFEIALGDLACVAGEGADGHQNEGDGGGRDAGRPAR